VQTESDPTPPLNPHPPRKSDVSQTHLDTLDLYQRGLSIAEIAVKRSMRETTIFDHLLKLIECSYEVTIDRVVSLEKSTVIEQAINTVGAERLTPIKVHLGDDYSYEEIKIVRARMRLTAKDQGKG
jgi:ATP-dependent DNA helicase RecQ